MFGRRQLIQQLRAVQVLGNEILNQLALKNQMDQENLTKLMESNAKLKRNLDQQRILSTHIEPVDRSLIHRRDQLRNELKSLS